MEKVVARENMWAALRRVEQNGGEPGVDGVTVKFLREYLRENWAQIRAKLLEGSYKPQPVRRVETRNPAAARGCWAYPPSWTA